jgi:hypothetical protein
MPSYQKCDDSNCGRGGREASFACGET